MVLMLRLLGSNPRVTHFGEGIRLSPFFSKHGAAQELARDPRVARLFPNEASLLRLVTAVLSQTSKEWETGKIYLNMEQQNCWHTGWQSSRRI